MLTKKGKYGLKALVHRSGLPMGQLACVTDIAVTTHIPPTFLDAILGELRNAGFVQSRKGKDGGYRLARAASVISVADIIQAIDGPLTVTACSTEAENCDQYAKCSVRDPLWRIRERIVSALATCSLQEISSELP